MGDHSPSPEADNEAGNEMSNEDNTSPYSLVVETDLWRDQLNDLEGLLKKCFDAVCDHDPACNGAVCVLFSDDKKLQSLNAQFRGQDKPTNVLSFPGDSFEGTDIIHLGDIALGYETCDREAREKEITFHDHAAHLIIHGLLHLCGYDHEEADEANQMETFESEILATMNIKNPYKDEEIL